MIRTKKTQHRAMHTAAKKLLAGSTTTRSNIQSNTSARGLSGATAQV
jgi:hypothetical protein